MAMTAMNIWVADMMKLLGLLTAATRGTSAWLATIDQGVDVLVSNATCDCSRAQRHGDPWMFIEELHGVADVRAEERLGGVDRCGDHVAERRDTEVHHLEAGVHVFLLVVLGYLLAARKRLMISAMAASSLRISAIASSMMCYLPVGLGFTWGGLETFRVHIR